MTQQTKKSKDPKITKVNQTIKFLIGSEIFLLKVYLTDQAEHTASSSSAKRDNLREKAIRNIIGLVKGRCLLVLIL